MLILARISNIHHVLFKITPMTGESVLTDNVPSSAANRKEKKSAAHWILEWKLKGKKKNYRKNNFFFS